MVYNNYIPNSKLNFSANVNSSFIDDKVVTNTVIVPGAYNTLKNETLYSNLNGSHSTDLNYNIAKQLDDRKYNLELNGAVDYTHDVAMSNYIPGTITSWRFNERLGPRINPNDWLEINPYASYDVFKSVDNLPGSLASDIQRKALNIDGKVYFLKNFLFGYSVSKNYVSGINADISKKPLIINAFFEKQFFKRKNGALSIRAFDLLDQNNFINRVVTPTEITDTRSNALSRYVLVSFKLNLQKWSGNAEKNGQKLKRRGDGSFIY